MSGPAATPRAVPISGGVIRLGQLLKLAGLVGSGGDARAVLDGGTVRVNGAPEGRRGRQVHPGDVVTVGGARLLVVDEATGSGA